MGSSVADPTVLSQPYCEKTLRGVCIWVCFLVLDFADRSAHGELEVEYLMSYILKISLKVGTSNNARILKELDL